MAPLNITYKPISDLIHPDYNPRQISTKDFEQLKKSLSKFEAVEPAVINIHPTRFNIIVGGNQRIRAATDLGWTEFPCVEVNLPEDKERELNVRLNKNTGEWDMDKLANMFDVGDLKDWGFSDFDLGGVFDDEDAADAEAQVDKAEELNKKWQVKKGDLWQLGDHRIICGDCTVVTDVERLMGTEKAVLMNTDPPYGVDYGGLVASREYAQGHKNKSVHKDIENDDLTAENLQKFLEDCIKTAVPFLIENPAFYLWHPMLTQGTFFAAAAADILIHRQIIWVKPSLILGRGDYHWRHELCFYGWYKGHRPNWYAGRDQDTVWEVGKENDNVHPTQKPIELFARPIKNHSKEGEVIYEPFSGSGSQIIAAENLNRKCYAVEIEPNYVAVAIQRWVDLTGKEPSKHE